MSINSTPEKAPYPVAAYLKPSSEERSASQLVGCDEATNLPCSIPVNVGLFFDGTNNHMGRDLKGQREPVPWTDKELKQAKNEARKAGRDPDAVKGPPPMLNLQLSKEQFSHSNVARLFRAFPDDKTSSGYHPVIPPANKGGQR